MVLDQVTVRNLELVEAAGASDDPAATLVKAIDETATGMGARLLRSWILRPQIDREEIEARLAAVAEMKSRTIAREEIRRELVSVLDIERLTSRITLGIATPRDLTALKGSLDRIPRLRGLFSSDESSEAEIASRLRTLRDELDEMADVREIIGRGIADDPPAVASEARRHYPSQIRSRTG